MKKILALVLLLAGIGQADVIKVTVNVQTAQWLNGVRVIVALMDAKVYVCSSPVVGVPCTNLASVYSDKDKTQPIAQPLATDKNGVIRFYVDNGSYQYTVTPKNGTPEGPYEVGVAGPPGPGGGGEATPALSEDAINVISSKPIVVGDVSSPANGRIEVTNGSGTVTVTLDGTDGVTSPQYCIGVSCITAWPSVSGFILGTDPRLSDARTPTTHTHAIADTTGLQAALDAKAPLSQPYDLHYNTPLTAATSTLADYFVRVITFPSGLTGSYCVAKPAPSADVVLSLRYDDVEWATCTVASGATAGTLAAGSQKVTAAGHYFWITPPADLKGITSVSLTLAGTR